MRQRYTWWWLWLGLLPMAGCSACEPVQPRAIGAQCRLTSECDAPLVCRLELCRVECSTSRDCAAGLDCLLDNEGFGACQDPSETDCALDSDCPELLTCVMGRCSNECNADEDCPPGARCYVIEDPAPITPTTCTAGAICGCIDRERTPCVYNEDCPALTICAPDQRCRDECISTADCRFGTVCDTVTYCDEEGATRSVRFCQPREDAGMPDAGPCG